MQQSVSIPAGCTSISAFLQPQLVALLPLLSIQLPASGVVSSSGPLVADPSTFSLASDGTFACPNGGVGITANITYNSTQSVVVTPPSPFVPFSLDTMQVEGTITVLGTLSSTGTFVPSSAILSNLQFSATGPEGAGFAALINILAPEITTLLNNYLQSIISVGTQAFGGHAFCHHSAIHNLGWQSSPYYSEYPAHFQGCCHCNARR